MDSNAIMMIAAAILIMISAILYFIATFFGNVKKKNSANNENQNELVVELKKQNALIQSQVEKLEREIRVLSGKQENQVKTIIKYNKENARQLAINERDTLMRVMQELKKAIENNAGSVVMKEVPGAVPVMEEVADADLFEVSGLPADEEEPVSVKEESVEPILEDLVTEKIPEEPETSDDLDLSSLFAGMEEEAPVAAESVLEDPFTAAIPEEPEASDDLDLSSLFAGMEEEAPVAAESVLEDPFAAAIPETSEIPEFSDELDLSTLFAEMEKEELPIVAAEEPMKAASASDPLEGFGSDPNAMMTPEDIARLLEAMGQ